MKYQAPTPRKIPFTKEGYDKILDEKKVLLSQRPEAVENLRKAREMGDLSENGYYKAARQRLSFLDARLRHIERLVKLGIIVESKNDGAIGIGNTVCITDGEKEYEYTIVGGYESNPKQKTISHLSPIGKALVGKIVNDQVHVVVPSGSVTYTVLRVS